MQSADTQFSAGDNVKRLNDGAPGVVRDTGAMGNVWVTWSQSGTTTVISVGLLERA